MSRKRPRVPGMKIRREGQVHTVGPVEWGESRRDVVARLLATPEGRAKAYAVPALSSGVVG